MNITPERVTMMDTSFNASTMIDVASINFVDSAGDSKLKTTELSMNNGNRHTVMNAASINFSDSDGESKLKTTEFSLKTSGPNSKKLSIYGEENNFAIDASGANLNLNVSTLFLSGRDAPTTTGTSVIAQGVNGLQWFTVSDLLSIEAGVFTNITSEMSADISFSVHYTNPPSVVITPSAAEGKIVPVAIDYVDNLGFKAIFGSNELKKFNFVVLPVSSTNSKNVSTANASVSRLNFSNLGGDGTQAGGGDGGLDNFTVAVPE
jgi:hypothetical protein